MRSAVQAWSEAHLRERLPADEFARLLAIPLTADEIAEVAALVTWFERRYPTARARFAYVRRALARRRRG
ncbi:MAG: hypothetical protein HS111_20155 [Kofleriaceae bacterium]|nr:hypothetical protein [Kofleriaceae bacterium]MCL4225288.1 hypothetical protein [Myxococcales bacterium]